VAYPSARLDFAAACGLNSVVAIAFWAAGRSKYGPPGYGDLTYHYDFWLMPVGTLLVLTTVVGLLCVRSRVRWRLGAGLLGGVLVAGAGDLIWTFGYLAFVVGS
jgi:hypothetical protein